MIVSFGVSVQVWRGIQGEGVAFDGESPSHSSPDSGAKILPKADQNLDCVSGLIAVDCQLDGIDRLTFGPVDKRLDLVVPSQGRGEGCTPSRG